MEVGDDGYFDLAPACNHQGVNNLIQTRLLMEVDWQGVMSNSLISDGVKLQIMLDVVTWTYGVESVDMSGFEITTNYGQISFGTTCPLINCANAKMCVELGGNI